MNNVLTIKATIAVESSGKVIDTLADWGCAIGNNDYIGEPEVETYFIDVPGADGFLDGSEAITGRPVYKSREIDILFGGKKPREDWDSFISNIRNRLHGKNIRITFSNDPAYYWTGRAYITDFDRSREIGQFHLSVPKADPYKYSLADSTEEWLWDPFDFETGVIDQGAGITISGSGSYTVYSGDVAIVPVLNVKSIGSTGLKVTARGETYTLTLGRNRFPDIVVYGSDVTLEFTGSGTLDIVYRRGSL